MYSVDHALDIIVFAVLIIFLAVLIFIEVAASLCIAKAFFEIMNEDEDGDEDK